MEQPPKVKEIPQNLRKQGGFVAYFHGQIVAVDKTLEGLMTQKEIQWLITSEDLIIGHLAPEGMIVVYYSCSVY